MLWYGMVMTKEVGFGDHHGVAEAALVCSVLHLFGEDVACVDDIWNVGDEGRVGLLSLADTVFSKVDVFGAFVGECRRPINASLVVIINGSAAIGLRHINISCSKFDVEKFFYTLVGGHDFSFAGTLGSALLAY